MTTQYVGEAELCDRVGFLSGGKLAAVRTPDELRRQAFGGEIVELFLDKDPGRLGQDLQRLEDLGHVREVRDDDLSGNQVSRVRLVVEDAESALPSSFDALNSAGTSIRSAAVLAPSFDEVFFRLVDCGP